MRYIDVDRLRAEIERRFWDYGTPLHDDVVTAKVDEVLSIIDSLQQEQPKKILTFAGFVDKVGTWFAHLRLDKFRKTFDGETFPATELVQRYDLFVRELSKQYSEGQEQPEVDLDADIEMEWDSFDKHLAKYGEESEDVVWINRYNFDEIARRFYKLGLKERNDDMK